jgi:predicted ester cyclase
MIRQFRTAFPDASFSLEGDFIAEGDKVVARWKGVATQKGAFGRSPATGKSATWTGISIFRIADGQVAEEIGEEDALSVFQQLGLVPPLGQGGR